MTSVSSSTSTTATTTTSSTTSTSSSSSTSDIDWDALITLAVAAKTSKADTIELKITDNEAKIAAYAELQTLLATLADTATTLRAASGSSLASTNVFLSRTAYLTGTGDVDASTAMAVTADAGADTGTHEVTVQQLAKAHKVAGDGVESKTTELEMDGTISIGTGENLASITITSDMTLAEIAEAINAESDDTGVVASVLAVSSTEYRLVLTASETGVEITAADSVGSVLSDLGVTDSQGAFATVLQEQASATFTVDGITITRTDNDVDDVLEGITLHLYEVTADDASVTVEIGTDLSAVKDAVVALVDAYNAVRDLLYANQQIPTDDNVDTTALFGDSTARNVSTALSSALNLVLDESSMALLGLTFDDTNNLELDEDVLDNALLDDLDAVASFLTFQMTSSSSDVLLLSRGVQAIGDLTLDIVTDSDGALVSASIDGDSSLFTVSDTRIIGAGGTIYEGYTFVFTGSSSQAVSITTSAGLAELLYNISDAASDSTDGTLTDLVTNLEDYNDDLQAKADDILEKAATYETNLTALYAKYQAAIEAAEASLDYLTTLIDTWNATS